MNDKVTFIINLAGDAQQKTEQLTGSLQKAVEQAEGLSGAFKKFGEQAIYINQFASAVSSAAGVFSDFADANRAQAEAQSRLGQVMRNTMGATQEQIQSICDLAAAQQQLGIVGDEVQLAGAQELGTYLSKTETLRQLLPVMNDMIAQQYGYNATQESAVNIATMMGKVMDGQTGALSRYGYSFTEAQEKILKFGTEEQRAATLAEVITDSVGGMNAALADTPVGRMQQLSNAAGDVKEQIGSYLTFAQPLAAVLDPVVKLLGLLPVLGTFFSAAGNAAQRAFRAAGNAAQWARTQMAAIRISAILSGGAFKLMGIMAQTACRAIGTAIMSIPVIGWIAAGITAAAALFTTLWQKSERFRIVVFTIWEAVKTVFNRVAKAAQTLFQRVYGGFIQPLWNTIRQTGIWINRHLVQPIVNVFARIADWLNNLFGGIFDTIVDKIRTIAEKAAKYIPGLRGILDRGEEAGRASWAASRQTDTTGDLIRAVNAPLAAANGAGAGRTQDNTAAKASQAVATGGTRNTEIHITIGDMIRQVVFNGTVRENQQDIERVFAESLSRVLGMAGA